MDPTTVFKRIWSFKAFTIPVLIVTLLLGAYVYEFGPRTYETTVSYAVITPAIPKEAEILKNPALGELNWDNPYLRATDPSLVTDVAITRLKSESSAAKLKARGLGDDYEVNRGAGGNGFVIDITGKGDSPTAAGILTKALGKMLVDDLYTMQKVNGADDLYLFRALAVTVPTEPTEQFSNRLRALVVVALGGIVLMFAAVSAGSALRNGQRRRRMRALRRSKAMPTPDLETTAAEVATTETGTRDQVAVPKLSDPSAVGEQETPRRDMQPTGSGSRPV